MTNLWVDLEKVHAVPYEGCVWLMDGLLIGPNPFCLDREDTGRRIQGLRRANVQCVVSLLSRDELFLSHEEEDEEWLENFDHHIFPIRDGGVPTKETMRLILNVIDQGLARNTVTFVHCWGGRGRSGLVAACFIARHGVAAGQAALNFIARKRFEVGLFAPAPETDVQMAFARSWNEGS